MRRTVLLLATLAIAAPAAAAAPSPILPGYWESTNRILSPIPTKSMDRRCLTPKDVEKFMMGPENRHYDCNYPVRSFVGGKIRLKGVCTSKKGREVEIDIATRQHANGVLEGLMDPVAVHEFPEVAVEVHGVRHHGVVDQPHSHSLIPCEAIGFRVLR